MKIPAAFSYASTRMMLAAITALLFTIFLGPRFIKLLYQLKTGQSIRVEDCPMLAQLHEKKKDTPSMGGTLILSAMLLCMFLWMDLRCSFTLLLCVTTIWLGLIGGYDDYLKLKHKNSKGLAGKKKLFFQILLAALISLYLLCPSVSNALHVGKWFAPPSAINPASKWVTRCASEARLNQSDSVLNDEDHSREAVKTREGPVDLRSAKQVQCPWAQTGPVGRPRRKIDLAKPQQADCHPFGCRVNKELVHQPVHQSGSTNKVKTELLSSQQYMGYYYAPFVKDPIFILKGGLLVLASIITLVVITGTSNAVNLTDGLDGLASGCLIMTSIVLAIFAFLSNNFEMSRYLNILYIENSGEIAIYLCALAGACLGFLWFNGYPAQIFMGDTGSLAMGGIIGLSAVLMRRELLLAVVGGIFVAEAGSVILQVASYKLRNKKRIFLCSPLHHHFEYKGWPETKVVLRFWIVSLLLAIIGLISLKFQ